MRQFLRGIAAVTAGAVTAVVVISGVEVLGHRFYPPPTGMDFNDPASVRALAPTMPVGAFLFVLSAYLLGSVVGAWAAARLAGHRPVTHGLIVGVLMLAGAVYNMARIPHPGWFQVAAVVVFLPAAYLGARLARGRAGPPLGL